MTNAPVVMVLDSTSYVLFRLPVRCRCGAWVCRFINRDGNTCCSECEENEDQPSREWWRNEMADRNGRKE